MGSCTWIRPSSAGMASALTTKSYRRHVIFRSYIKTHRWNWRGTQTHKLHYYDKIEFDEHGWLITPPGDYRLSDALVSLIVGQDIVVARTRHGKWLAGFNSDGDIYPDRWPVGEPVIVFPFIPVFADYYALVGFSEARRLVSRVNGPCSGIKFKADYLRGGILSGKARKTCPKAKRTMDEVVGAPPDKKMSLCIASTPGLRAKSLRASSGRIKLHNTRRSYTQSAELELSDHSVRPRR